MKACIFLDIDGTLLDHEIGIQESSRIAIAQAQANGHRVCLATGRPKPEVDDEIQAIPFDGCIYSCGAMVESHGKVLFYRVKKRSTAAFQIKSVFAGAGTSHDVFTASPCYRI